MFHSSIERSWGGLRPPRSDIHISRTGGSRGKSSTHTFATLAADRLRFPTHKKRDYVYRVHSEPAYPRGWGVSLGRSLILVPLLASAALMIGTRGLQDAKIKKGGGVGGIRLYEGYARSQAYARQVLFFTLRLYDGSS